MIPAELAKYSLQPLLRSELPDVLKPADELMLQQIAFKLPAAPRWLEISRARTRQTSQLLKWLPPQSTYWLVDYSNSTHCSQAARLLQHRRRDCRVQGMTLDAFLREPANPFQVICCLFPPSELLPQLLDLAADWLDPDGWLCGAGLGAAFAEQEACLREQLGDKVMRVAGGDLWIKIR